MARWRFLYAMWRLITATRHQPCRDCVDSSADIRSAGGLGTACEMMKYIALSYVIGLLRLSPAAETMQASVCCLSVCPSVCSSVLRLSKLTDSSTWLSYVIIKCLPDTELTTAIVAVQWTVLCRTQNIAHRIYPHMTSFRPNRVRCG